MRLEFEKISHLSTNCLTSEKIFYIVSFQNCKISHNEFTEYFTSVILLKYRLMSNCGIQILQNETVVQLMFALLQDVRASSTRKCPTESIVLHY